MEYIVNKKFRAKKARNFNKKMKEKHLKDLFLKKNQCASLANNKETSKIKETSSASKMAPWVNVLAS